MAYALSRFRDRMLHPTNRKGGEHEATHRSRYSDRNDGNVRLSDRSTDSGGCDPSGPASEVPLGAGEPTPGRVSVFPHAGPPDVVTGDWVMD